MGKLFVAPIYWALNELNTNERNGRLCVILYSYINEPKAIKTLLQQTISVCEIELGNGVMYSCSKSKESIQLLCLNKCFLICILSFN